MVIKAVIFDMFGVLVSAGFESFLDDNFGNDKIKREAAMDLVRQFDRALLTKEEYLSSLSELSGLSKEKILDGIGQNRSNKTLLEYIKTNLEGNYKLGVLSNAGDDYFSQFIEDEYRSLFDDVVLSYLFGMSKPDQSIYLLSAERLDVLPEECIFIDDSPGHCIGATAVGMQSLCYQNFTQTKGELEAILNSSGADN